MKIKHFLGYTVASLGLVFAFGAAKPASAQISINIGGGPPSCAYGYYDYAPYSCAPSGFYGPGYFYNGIFLGVGPWYQWGYHHGWGGHRFGGPGGGRYAGRYGGGYHGGGYHGPVGHGGPPHGGGGRPGPSHGGGRPPQGGGPSHGGGRPPQGGGGRPPQGGGGPSHGGGGSRPPQGGGGGSHGGGGGDHGGHR